MPYEFKAEAARHRKVANECRTMAHFFDDEEIRTQYLKLAEAYEELADHEERVAVNLPH